MAKCKSKIKIPHIRIHYRLYEAVTWKLIALDATQISCSTHICTGEAAVFMGTTAKAKQQAEEICLGQEIHEMDIRPVEIFALQYVKIQYRYSMSKFKICFSTVSFFGQEKRNTFLVCTCMGPTAKHGGGAVMVLCWWYVWGFTHLAFLCLNLSLPNCRYSFPTTLFLNPLRQVSALHCPPAQQRCTLVCVTVISLTAAR